MGASRGHRNPHFCQPCQAREDAGRFAGDALDDVAGALDALDQRGALPARQYYAERLVRLGSQCGFLAQRGGLHVRQANHAEPAGIGNGVSQGAVGDLIHARLADRRAVGEQSAERDYRP
jgi:hypothetical protein